MTARVTTQKTTLTDVSQLDFTKLYTYEEYYTWQFPERIELIDGMPYQLTSPSTNHQRVSMRLSILWGNFLNSKSCEVFAAPIDVYFPNPSGGKMNTVVQPDLCIVCDTSKIEDKGIKGAPDLVIEILSLNNKRDLTVKFNLYEREGVQEYWIINPSEKWLIIYTLNDKGKYSGSKHFTSEDGSITAVLFPEFKVDLVSLFDFGELKQ